jgi:hypothetical protein
MSRILTHALRAFGTPESFGGAPTGTFRIVAYPGTERWVRNSPCLRRVGEYFSDPSMVVHVYPRSMADQVLGKPKPPYTYRAFTRDGQSYVFVDRTETPRSICWLIAHELTHQLIDKSPTVKAAMSDASARRTNLDPAGDRFHQIDAEERFCDGIATNLVGARLDRDWWRQRTHRHRQ